MKHLRAVRTVVIVTMLAAAGSLIPASPAHAATISWTGAAASADVFDPDNWDGGVVPDLDDDVNLPESAVAKTLQVDGAISWEVNSLEVADAGYVLQGSGIAKVNTALSIQPNATLDLLVISDLSTVSVASTATLDFTPNYNLAGLGLPLANDGVINLRGAYTSAPGAGSFVHSGNGRLNVTGNFSNEVTILASSGQVNVPAGEVVADGNLVDISDSAVLMGEGTVFDAAVSGTLNPGEAGGAGQMTVDDLNLNVDPANRGTLQIDINGTAPGAFDSVVANTVDLAGSSLVLNPTIDPQIGDVFTIIDRSGAAAVTGTFDGLPEGAEFTVAGEVYKISYTGGTNNNEVTLTVVPNPQVVQFLNPTATVSESSSSVTLPVSRDASSGSRTVNYATADGTAVAGEDYVATSGTLTFAPGETVKDVVVPIVNNDVNENNEAFTVALSSPSTGSVLGANSTSTVTITDNDGAGDGYWLAATDGGVFAYGGAQFYGSMGGKALNGQVVDIVSNESGDGYWLIGSDGGVFAYGGAQFHGSTGGSRLNSPVLGGARTTANGYWLFAADGGVFSFGDAKFFGSLGNRTINAPIVDMAVTPTGNGYWLFASDGGVFAFGDARFVGSLGGQKLNAPVLGAARTPDGNGYWLTAADGGVFAFGTAKFNGSMGGQRLNSPVRSIGQTESGNGYWLFATDGGVFAFGDAQFLGSMGGKPLNAPVIAGASNS